ncbi:peptidoglycan bridge formation glycyltransferase FemA/FemB family protein [Candidatus Peregrinibacteria bacterium]|nr:peptidoglycan bridge formation glycyltransferase FemA/FemB family protein [Candidatus Peregrinibacteria bacterium]
MKVIEIQTGPAQLLPKFIERHPLGTIHQIPEWGEFQRAAAKRDQYWILALQDEQNNLLATSLVIRQRLPFNKCWLYAPRGPLINFENQEQTEAFFASIKELAKKEKAVFFRFDPPFKNVETSQNQLVINTLKTLGAHKAHAHYQPECTLMVDLTVSPEEILKQMKPKGRYNIKVAQKHGVEIEICHDPEKGIDEFYNLFSQTTERDGFSGHQKSYYLSMLKTLGQKHAKLYLAKYQGKALAACIVTYFKDTATYYFGASSSEHRNTMAPYLLHYKAMIDAKDLGYKYYDFFGIAPENEPNHPWAKVTDFKKKFGGKVINYFPAQEIIYKKCWYTIVRIAKFAKKIIGR